MMKPTRSASIVLLSCVALVLFGGCSNEQKAAPDENAIPEPVTQGTVNETVQPQQAQDILRQIPEDQHGQYKLTTAELGTE